MDATRTTEPSPLFADSPADQFRRGWQYATAGNGSAPLLPGTPIVPHTPRWHWWALILITLFAGVTRFAWLDRPSIWGDEAATFRRVCGTYEQMLQTLEQTRFMPLHYQAYWLLGQLFEGKTPAEALTPQVMRLIPAIAGVLMVPAMYFLARQLVSRRASLLTALFTACSAYIFVYSRDAKMYMHFWLCLALNMASFLWWLRTRSLTGWLGWIAAGSAACGLHMTALGVIAIQPIMLLTQRRAHWVHAIVFAIGLGLILAGPLGYYFHFNRFGQKIEEAGWNSTGIQWVAWRNKNHGAAVLSLDSAAAYLFAYNYLPESIGGTIPDHIWNAAIATMGVFLVLFVVGALPWSRRLRGDRLDDPAAEPWWRSTLWLGTWILIPTAAVAYLSLKTRITPAEMFTGAAHWLGQPWLRHQPRQDPGWMGILHVLESRAFFIVAAGVLIGAMTLLWRYIPRVLAAVLGYAIIVGLVLTYIKHGTLQVLLIPTEPEHGLIRNVGLLVLLILVPPLLWYFSGATLGERFRKSGQFLLVAAVLFGMVWVVAEVIRKPLDGPVWMPRYLGFIWPAVAVAACALLVRLPTRPLRYMAIAFVLGVNLLQSGARVFAGNEPPLAQVSADVLADFHGDEVLTFTPPLRGDNNLRFSGAPGTGAVLVLGGRGWMYDTPAARYYLLRGAGIDLSPETFQHTNSFTALKMRPAGLPGMIATEARNHPEVNRIIVWQQLPITPPAEPEDAIANALGAEWERVSEQLHNVRFYWSWADLYTYRRREYVRVAAPATQPAAATQATAASQPAEAAKVQ